MQNRFGSGDDERVASIVTTLEPGDGSSAIGQQVDDLALALIAPLGAYDYNVFTHPPLPDDEQEHEPDRRDRQTCEPQCSVIHLCNTNDGLAKQGRARERDHALDDQVNRKTG